jgi:hypothetical protein
MNGFNNYGCITFMNEVHKRVKGFLLSGLLLLGSHMCILNPLKSLIITVKVLFKIGLILITLHLLISIHNEEPRFL